MYIQGLNLPRVGGEKTAWYPLLLFVCKWSVKLIRIRPIHFRIIEKKQVRKALSVRVRCLETCHAVRNLLHTVIFRSVGTCLSVPRSAPRSVFRDLYCKSRRYKRGAERGTERGTDAPRRVYTDENANHTILHH